MQIYDFYYKQIVTSAELNAFETGIQQAIFDVARDIDEYGIFQGLTISPQSPISTSVEISQGVAKLSSTGERCYNPGLAVVACNEDEFGAPVYSDLLAGEGRWASIFIKFKRVFSDPRTDGGGTPINYNQAESYEFFVHIGTKGLIANKLTLGRAGVLSTASMLGDIWFEAGAVDVASADIDYSRREDFYSQIVNGALISAGSPKNALLLLGTEINGISTNLSDADLSTGASDGAHLVGVGGHASEAEWSWEGGARFLNAPGDNVHDVLAKIVSDLGDAQGQGVSGGMLISADTTPPDWYGSGAPPLGSISGTYDGSIMGGILSVVSDLNNPSGGANLIASEAYFTGSSYQFSADKSVQGHLKDCVDFINDHVTSGGHDSDIISYIGSAAIFADGTSLPASTVYQAFNDVVYSMGQSAMGATTAGTWKIGGSGFGASYLSKSLIITGGTSLQNQLQQFATNMIMNISVTGDDRLSGVFLPQVTGVVTLGSTSLALAEVWSGEFKGSAISTLFRGEQFTTLSSGGGLTIVTDTGDIGISAPAGNVNLTANSEFDFTCGGLMTIKSSGGNIQIDTAGALSLALGGSDKITWSDTVFYPNLTASIDFGTNVNRWNKLYTSGSAYFGGSISIEGASDLILTTGEIKTSHTNILYRYMNACATACFGTADDFTYSVDGSHIDANATKSTQHHLDVATGQTIESIYFDWWPIAGGMNGILRKRVFGSSTITTVTNVAVTIGVRTISSDLAVSEFVDANTEYWIDVDHTSGNSLYAIKIGFSESKWPR